MHETDLVTNSNYSVYACYDFCCFLSFSKFQLPHSLNVVIPTSQGWKELAENKCRTLTTVVAHGYGSVNTICDNEYDNVGAEDRC